MDTDAKYLDEEAKAWVDIHDALVREMSFLEQQNSMERKAVDRAMLETQAMRMHNELVREATLEYHHLCSKFFQVMNGSMAIYNNTAVAELIAWKEILDAQAPPHAETTVAQKEAGLSQALTRPDLERLEAERHRAEDARKEADRQTQAALEQLAHVQREKKALEQQITSLMQDRHQMEMTLQQLRIETQDDRMRHEAELKDLREQIRTERALLDNLKAANNAASVSHPATQRTAIATTVAAAATNSPVGAASPTHSNRGLGERHDSYTYSLSGSSSPVREYTPSLNSGLKALHNVREQLRDIREAHNQSPLMRASSASGFAHGTSNRGAGYGATAGGTSPTRDLHRAHTTANFSPGANNYGPGSPNAEPSSPWKTRLSKLQGDLRSLKQELGTNPAGTA